LKAKNEHRSKMSNPESIERQPTEILNTALEWLESGRQVALATVVETCGSSPRPVGSNLVVSNDGTFEGSVSGGCVEGAVVSAAQEVIATGEPRPSRYSWSASSETRFA
jgi:xanthine/CO dehydrogenase XdhC/CoxF family maturation factor